MYQVNLLKKAQKDLQKIDKRFQEKIVATLRLLRINPFLGEKMSSSFLGSYRIKIPPMRIVYKVDLKDKIIWVRAIGHRQGIYH